MKWRLVGLVLVVGVWFLVPLQALAQDPTDTPEPVPTWTPYPTMTPFPWTPTPLPTQEGLPTLTPGPTSTPQMPEGTYLYMYSQIGEYPNAQTNSTRIDIDPVNPGEYVVWGATYTQNVNQKLWALPMPDFVYLHQITSFDLKVIYEAYKSDYGDGSTCEVWWGQAGTPYYDSSYLGGEGVMRAELNIGNYQGWRAYRFTTKPCVLDGTCVPQDPGTHTWGSYGMYGVSNQLWGAGQGDFVSCGVYLIGVTGFLPLQPTSTPTPLITPTRIAWPTPAIDNPVPWSPPEHVGDVCWTVLPAIGAIGFPGFNFCARLWQVRFGFLGVALDQILGTLLVFTGAMVLWKALF